jgi:3-isopropylmalate dehydratase small subunit
MVLNLLEKFGANRLLGFAIEIEGDAVESFSLDQRITISSMATEMGAIIIFFPPNLEVIRYCESRSMRKVQPQLADPDAIYAQVHPVDISKFSTRISMPGKPHDTAELPREKVWIDSAFIGSCTNGRMEDLRSAAKVLKGRVVAEGVVLKIVPATDRIWQQCLEEGLLETFKESGAMISNAGCAGCAAGQVGQNGPGEVTISTGNRNFPGKQGQGEVYLASPAVVAAAAVAGYITGPDAIPDKPVPRGDQNGIPEGKPSVVREKKTVTDERPVEIKGRVWYIPRDNIDTDMIFHNRYLAITDIDEMGRFTFDNLEGYENFASRVKKGDIVVAGKNFGSGSSRQQAVDCFISLGVQCIVAESFGAIYERNAINAAFPIVTATDTYSLKFDQGEEVWIHLEKGIIRNLSKDITLPCTPFSEVQMEIYQNNGLF